MKKIIAFILLLTMMVSLVACGNDDESKKPVQDETTSLAVENETDDSSESPSTPNKSKLTGTYKVPLKAIVVDIPDYQAISSGYTQLYVVGRDLNIAITTCRDEVATTLEDAHDSAFELFKVGYSNYASIDALVIETDKLVKVNDRELYYYEGYLRCHNDTGEHKYYTVGYSFIMDNIACNISGNVLEESQPDKLKTEVKDNVNAMIQTLRDKK